MTVTTEEIFKNHQIRKTADQRKSFRSYLSHTAESYGYKVKCEKCQRGAVNVVVGEPSIAKVIYSAHYDTCAVMPLPNFITPKCFPIYLAYQLILTTIMFFIPFLIMFVGAPHVLEHTGSRPIYTITLLGGYALLWVILYLAMNGPANKHTANDNTSGVTLLLDIMRDLPEEYKDSVAFIFFDLEEKGLIGSRCYKMMHKDIARTKPLINFDCVSDGSNILFAIKKNAVSIAPKLEEAFKPTEKYSVDIATKGVFYPSDQRNFDLGIGVAALKKAKCGVLYMDKIHTARDTVYDEENIEYLKNGAIELAKMLAKNASNEIR